MKYASYNYLFAGVTEKEALENNLKETELAMKWFMNTGFLCEQEEN